MSELKDLVPPLKLCKLIPAGEFLDAAHAWHYTDVVGFVCRTSGCNQVSGKRWELERSNGGRLIRARARGEEKYPAPTTDEILDKCKDISGVLNPTLWYQHEWIADCAYDRTGKLSTEFFEDDDFKNLDIIEGRDKDPVIAAMKLYLKLKGIEYAE